MKLTFLFLLFSAFLISQEQVSEINTPAVNKVTNIGSKIGFAQIGNVDYMLIENDTLSIYKWNGHTFILDSEIEAYDFKFPNGLRLDPNRSQLEIRNGKYYRFYYNAMEIVDIVSGTVEFLYDGGENGYSNIYPTELVDERLYFNAWEDRVRRNKRLDVSTGKIEDLGETPRPSLKQIGDIQFQISDSIISLENLWLADQNRSSFFTNGILNVHLSRSDSSFVVLDGAGELYQLKLNGVQEKYDCKIDNLENLSSMRLAGDKLILSNEFGSNVRFRVINLITCEQEQSFNINVTDDFATHVSFITNETGDKDFTIVGVNGVHPADGWDPGFFYIIDHVNKREVQTPKITGVLHHTPFRIDNSVFFIGFNSSFWTGQLDVILQYDMNSGQIIEHVPEGDQLSHATLGYFRDGKLFCATNTIHEEVKVLQLDQTGKFNEIMKASFLNNEGITDFRDIKALEDKIYFLTIAGFYSVDDHDETILKFDYNPLISNTRDVLLGVTLHTYKDKISFITNDAERHPHFHVYDLTTGKLNTHIDSTVSTSLNSVDPAGPFYFYSNGTKADTLKIFDIRDGSIIEFSELPYAVAEFGRENAAFFFYRFDGTEHMYSIDYESKNIELHQFDFKSSNQIVSGRAGVDYFIDQENGQIRIRRMKSVTDIETIYDGPGSLMEFKRDKDSDFSFFSLRLSWPNVRIIVDDSQKTEMHDIIFRHDNNHDSPIVAIDDDKVVLFSNIDDSVQFKILKAFEGIDDIDYDTEKANFTYADLSEDEGTFFIFDEHDSLVVMTYNLETQDTQFRKMWTGCDPCTIYEGIRINKNKFLISWFGRSPYEGEPRIVDLAMDSLYLLADLNTRDNWPSYTNNYIRFKDWIYFTANLREGDRQWFRLLATDNTTNIEAVKIDNIISPFPNPTTGSISINRDYETMSIFSLDGTELYKMKNVNAESSIDVSQLGIGTFLLLAIDKNGNHFSGKIVKI